MSVEKKVPEIRFKGFSGEWEVKKTSEICSISTGKNNTQDKVSDGKYPFYVRSAIIEKSNNYIFDEEAVLTVGDGVGTGKVYHYINGKYDLHQRVYRMFNFSGVDAKYFYHYFSDNFNDRVMSMTAKTSVDSVRLEMIADMDILLPELNEQKKVARCLDQVDSLINQHQQKHDQLSNIKKAMLEKMFPKQGETTPEIRFKGFSGEWDETTLGEVFTYERPDSYIVESVDYSDEYSTPVLTANKGFLLGYTNEEATYNNPSIIFDDFTLDSKFVDFPYMVKSSAIKILTVKDDRKHDLMFAFNLLNTTRLEVMGHARHYIGVVQNTKVPIPSKSEQTAIGNTFQKLDTLINQHQNQITKLNNIKQACLSKMFV